MISLHCFLYTEAVLSDASKVKIIKDNYQGSQSEHETAREWLIRCIEQDFYDGVDGCSFPDAYLSTK